jgi:hypothetical protein
MCLIWAPLFKPAFVDRAPDLFGTRRPDGSFRLVEVHAALIERQAAIIQQAADLSFEVIQDVFMLYPQDAPRRQDSVPVVHQVDIGPVVLADVFQAVGEFLPFGEELLEAGPAAIHRIAPRIDDLRIGQDQVDQPDMPEIVRHLVREISGALPVDAGVLDVVLTQGTQLLCGHVMEDAGVTVPVGDLATAAQAVGQRENVG